LVRILNADPTNKALVFSQWSEPLAQLKTLLDRHGIGYMSGPALHGIKSPGKLASRINAFKMENSVRVLLLNTLKQSTGLTLTVANNVLLIDPVDMASEDQAIGRVHRFGQHRTTYLYRYGSSSETTPEKLLNTT